MKLSYQAAVPRRPTAEVVKRVLDQFRDAVCNVRLPPRGNTNHASLKAENTSMLDLARDVVGTQPILAIFLAIGLGYLVGQINIFGFSLGVGAVLFVGLAIGGLAPRGPSTAPRPRTALLMVP